MQPNLVWDVSYHDFLKVIINIPRNRYAARRFAWEDYIKDRVSEILELARRHADTHVFEIADPDGEALQATICVAPLVDASVWRGEQLVYECIQARREFAEVGMIDAILR
jgi:hypothetical protein